MGDLHPFEQKVGNRIPDADFSISSPSWSLRRVAGKEGGKFSGVGTV